MSYQYYAYSWITIHATAIRHTNIYYTMHEISSANMGFWSANIQRYITQFNN